MSVFGYKIIHTTLIVYGTTILFDILYVMYTCLCAGFSLYKAGNSGLSFFLCTVWDSLIHHIASTSLFRAGRSRNVIGETQEWVGGGEAMGNENHDLGPDKRIKGDEV